MDPEEARLEALKLAVALQKDAESPNTNWTVNTARKFTNFILTSRSD